MACRSSVAAIVLFGVNLAAAMSISRGGRRAASLSQRVTGRSGLAGANLCGASALGLTTRGGGGRVSSITVSRQGMANCEAGRGPAAASVGHGQTCGADAVSGRLITGGQHRAPASKGSETESRRGPRSGPAFSDGLFAGLSVTSPPAI